MEKLHTQLGRLSEKVIAYAGYGSEENFAYLEDKGIETFVKYIFYDREQKKRRKLPERAVYWSSNWEYDEQQDEFVCPQGKRISYEETRQTRTENGYIIHHRTYHCKDCDGCPVRDKCTRSERGRTVSMSLPLRYFRQQARERLLSPLGKQLRIQRTIEPEAVFGWLKHNWGFRRFLTRGLEMVTTEWGLLCLAQNITKLTA